VRTRGTRHRGVRPAAWRPGDRKLTSHAPTRRDGVRSAAAIAERDARVTVDRVEGLH